ncbi:MAG: prohead protease [Clostridium chrysemydis]|uniref:prohead protease n=1 Tax=Clostridium chrysemydis TaxID=2665504 RepID=UPI003F3C6A21
MINIFIDPSIIKKKLVQSLNDESLINLLPNKRVYFIHAADQNLKTPYVEYQVINSSPSDYAEGDIKYINHIIQVDIFSSIYDSNLGDYTELEKIIINKLCADGFELNPGSPDLFEEKTKLNHKPIRFNIDLPASL